MTFIQQTTLIVLRTLIGWHFLYEGYTKLLQPAWGRSGAPIAPSSSAGYLKAATGPLAPMFHSLGGASWIGTFDILLAVLLLAVGVSLMLGFFARADKTEIDALSEARFFEPRNTANPLSEPAVRRMIAELARGEPNYDLLSPGMQEVTRAQLPGLQRMFQSLGEIESVTFVEVGPQGGDVFDVKFANGAVRWNIALTADGKTAGAGVRPLGPLPGGPPAAPPPQQ